MFVAPVSNDAYRPSPLMVGLRTLSLAGSPSDETDTRMVLGSFVSSPGTPRSRT